MRRKRNVRDPVWGEIEVSDTEWQVLNLPVMQRLRRVHQLGLTMLVFPGATHTRFEHSLGTCHVAGLIADKLLSNPAADVAFGEDSKRIVRLAALLHDVGHGPFSHVSDPLFEGLTHEEVGALMLESETQLVATLDADTRASIAGLLRGQLPRTVERDIVAGPADADKIDYLLRDSLYAGVETGKFDYGHLIDQAKAFHSKPDTLLGFRWSGLWAVEGMLLARHHMHRTVYGHRNRLVTDLMLERAMRAAMADGWLPAALFRIPKDGAREDFLRMYLEWDDWRVLSIGYQASGRAGEMFRRLRDHRLLKLLVHLEGDELGEALGDGVQRLLDEKGVARLGQRVEPRLAAELDLDSDELIVRLEDAKHPLARPARGAGRANDILIERPSGRARPLNVVSEIFAAVPPAAAWTRLYVYSPSGMKDAPEMATRARSAVVRLISDVLTEDT